jgi:superfamily II DNA/RNA helicase
MSKQSFADLGVSDAVTRALGRRGVTQPFAVQSLVIGDILAGRDVLAKSPTGSGKTLAFAIPLADRIAADGARPAALVLAPTRELASQIVEESRAAFNARALSIAAVYGGVGISKQAKEASKAHIVVATPGRLEDLLERGVFSLANVRFLVVDEGDRMLDMGFRPALDRIVGQCPTGRQTMFFSATLEGDAGRAAREYTRDAVRHEHSPTALRKPAIEHRFVAVKHANRVEALVGELTGQRDLALVFVRTKHGADRLVKRLRSHGVTADAMHGNKSQGQRERTLASFEAGHVNTLVATDVAARGIHVEGISHVINFDPPQDRDNYIHRVGRTGRAGRSGIGITFVDAEQAHEVRQIASQLKLHTEFEESGLGRRNSTGRRRRR